MKPADQLLPSDFTDHRVWEFVDDMETELPDETHMRPVVKLPVTSLAGRVVGARLTFVNSQQLLGALGNISLKDTMITEHFLTVTIFARSGERFDLARYHDVDYERHGAKALAAFCGLPVHLVFPICYDITDIAVGHSDCLRRSIPAIPASQLSKDELIGLALKVARETLES